jgi:hypothetical protein
LGEQEATTFALSGSRTHQPCVRCGVGSHAMLKKAVFEDGHGYVPSVTDRSNTESVFLEPSVNAAWFPGAITELLGQCLLHEEWIVSFTALPTAEEMENSPEVGHELVAEVMEKSKHVVSFAITPAKQKPFFPN